MEEEQNLFQELCVSNAKDTYKIYVHSYRYILRPDQLRDTDIDTYIDIDINIALCFFISILIGLFMTGTEYNKCIAPDKFAS